MHRNKQRGGGDNWSDARQKDNQVEKFSSRQKLTRKKSWPCHDPVVDDRVHPDGDRVPGQDLLRGHVERDRAQVHHRDGVHAGEDEEEAGSDRAALAGAPEAENDGALVLLQWEGGEILW